MQFSPGLRNPSLLSTALLFGGLAGWYAGRLIGLYGDEWFAEPEYGFEALTALCGILCGALFAYTLRKGVAPRMVGVFIAGGFVLAMFGYARYSTDMPPYDLELTTYLRNFIRQTLGLWLSPIIGAALVSSFRAVLH